MHMDAPQSDDAHHVSSFATEHSPARSLATEHSPARRAPFHAWDAARESETRARAAARAKKGAAALDQRLAPARPLGTPVALRDFSDRGVRREPVA